MRILSEDIKCEKSIFFLMFMLVSTGRVSTYFPYSPAASVFVTDSERFHSRTTESRGSKCREQGRSCRSSRFTVAGKKQTPKNKVLRQISLMDTMKSHEMNVLPLKEPTQASLRNVSAADETRRLSQLLPEHIYKYNAHSTHAQFWGKTCDTCTYDIVISILWHFSFTWRNTIRATWRNPQHNVNYFK